MFEAAQSQQDTDHFALVLAFSKTVARDPSEHIFESEEEKKIARVLSEKIDAFLEDESLSTDLWRVYKENEGHLAMWLEEESKCQEEYDLSKRRLKEVKRDQNKQLHRQLRHQRTICFKKMLREDRENARKNTYKLYTKHFREKYIRGVLDPYFVEMAIKDALQSPVTGFSLWLQTLLRCMFKHTVDFLNKESPEILQILEQVSQNYEAQVLSEEDDSWIYRGALEFKKSVKQLMSFCLRCGKKKTHKSLDDMDGADTTKRLYLKGFDKNTSISFSLKEASVSPLLFGLAQISSHSNSKPIELKFSYEVLECIHKYVQLYENNPDAIDLDFFSVKKTFKSELIKETLLLGKNEDLRKNVFAAADFLGIPWLMQLMAQDDV